LSCPEVSTISRPELLPSASVRSSCARVGTCSAKLPAPSSSTRVQVLLSSTTATFGGSKSSGIAQAAAMMLRCPPCAALTSTVGPWFMRR
jgi:hypothetical protein